MSRDSIRRERSFVDRPEDMQQQSSHDNGSANVTFGIEVIKKTLRKADEELAENLKLFVERLVLYRITRVKEKAPELALFARFLLEAASLEREEDENLSRAAPSFSEEISSIEALRNEKLSPSDVAGLFSAMVDALENLNGKQLYYILEKLRTEPMARH
jgi:DNA-binding GntR family transcriptional regulator